MSYPPDHDRVIPARKLIEPAEIPGNQVGVADRDRHGIWKIAAPRVRGKAIELRAQVFDVLECRVLMDVQYHTARVSVCFLSQLMLTD